MSMEMQVTKTRMNMMKMKSGEEDIQRVEEELRWAAEDLRGGDLAVTPRSNAGSPE